MDGIEYLRQASDLLNRPAQLDPRRRLRQAARRFWQAVYEFDTWPSPIQDEAAAVLRHLFRDGVIDDTVDKASNDTVELLTHEIRTFCDDAERHLQWQFHAPHETASINLPQQSQPHRTFGDFL